MRRAKDEKGQAMVEFVLVLPLFLGLVFLAIGFGITLNNYLRVTDIARVGARAASIARFSGQPNPCKAAVTAATAAAGGLAFTSPVSCTYPNGNQPGQPVIVTVTIDSQNALTTLPFLSVALPKTLTSKATVVLQ